MGNRRVILFLLTAIAVCMLLLWHLHVKQQAFGRRESTRSRVIDEALGRVERLTIDRGEARMCVELTGGRWRMTAPFPAQVEQGAVARLLDAFESAQVKDAIAFQELRKRELSLRDFGLAPPRIRVTLEGPQHIESFLVGAFTPLSSELYLRVDVSDQILVVPAALFDAIPHTADDLRSRKLVHSARNAIRMIEVRAPGRPFITLSKETGTWRLIQPTAAPADDERVSALLDTLYAARLTYFVWPTVSNVMDVAQTDSALKTRMGLYGLGPDSGIQLTVQENGSTPPEKIILGHTLDGAASLCYALLPGGEAIGAVSNSVADAFRLSVADLRDPRPFSGPAADIQRLQIHLGDTLFVLTQTNGFWRFESPVSDEADPFAVRDTIDRILSLRADAIFENGEDTKTAVHERPSPISHVELTAEQVAWRFLVVPGDLEVAVFNLIFTNAPTVYQVASSNLPPALVNRAGVFSLRDKSVLRLPRASVRRIAVTREGAPTMAVERASSEALWHLGEGTAGHIVDERLQALLACIENLQADRIEGVGLDADQFATFGLREPWLEISIDVDARDAVRKTLQIGREAGFGKRYAAVRGLDVLFVLDRTVLDLLTNRIVEPLTP